MKEARKKFESGRRWRKIEMKKGSLIGKCQEKKRLKHKEEKRRGKWTRRQSQNNKQMLKKK